MQTSKYILATLFWLVLPSVVQAQEALNADLEGRFWTGVGVKLDVAKNWTLDVKQQLRLDSDGSRFQQTFTEAEVGYSFNKRLDVFQEYRFSVRRTGLTQRIGSGVSYQILRSKPWYLTLRGKYQHEFIPVKADEGDWRVRAKLRYRVNKRWSVHGSVENWTGLYPVPDLASRFRGGVGASFNRKDHDITWQFFYQQSLPDSFIDPGRSYILALFYTFEP